MTVKKLLLGLATASVLASTMMAAPASAQPYYGPHRDRTVIVRRGPVCTFRTVISRDRFGHRVVSRCSHLPLTAKIYQNTKERGIDSALFAFCREVLIPLEQFFYQSLPPLTLFHRVAEFS